MLQIPQSSYKIMPWQNGLGVTAEIDREPVGTGAYLWRLSQASIGQDSAFSIFPGFDRWLCVWQGNAIFLNERKVAPLEPILFSGDENILCRLSGGPVRDVGLIFDRAKIKATMKIVKGGIDLPRARAHYLFDLESGNTVKIEAASGLPVAPSLLVSINTL